MLRLLALNGCIVTIDAMGCQTEIAQAIIDQGGDYVLALKGNQGNLHRDVQDLIAYAQETNFKDVDHDFHETVEKNHGRIETRRHWVITEPEFIAYLDPDKAWAVALNPGHSSPLMTQQSCLEQIQVYCHTRME